MIGYECLKGSGLLVNNVETYECCICGSTHFSEVYPNRYESLHSIAEYQSMMSSSSHAPLIDALARCTKCGHMQTNPRLEMENVLKGYIDAVDPNHIRQDLYREKTFIRTMAHLSTLSELRKSKTVAVLDIGCASGAFLNSVNREFGWQGIGLEPSKWMCDYGRNTYGLDLRSTFFSADLFTYNSFDLVTLWDVIEHISEPNIIFSDIAKILKTHGLLVINIPNSNSIVARFLGKHWPFLLAVHIHYFTPKSLAQILDKHGFELIESKPYFQSLGLGYIINRGCNILGGGLRFMPVSLSQYLDRLSFRYNMGQTTFVARKKNTS
jgi:SAM-dependent methyltransferase